MAPERIAVDPGQIPDPVQFFDSFHNHFEAAAGKSDQVAERYFLIYQQVIRLKFAGPALVSKLTPALQHLAVEPVDDPDLTICIWDSASTGTKIPPLPPTLPKPRGDVPGYMNKRISSHIGADLFSILDRDRRLAIYWCADASQIPIYERGAPLRSILHWWFQGLGIQLVHAGAIGTRHGAVLLAGKGGSGKSTTCLACLASELYYISDDYTLIGLEPRPFVQSIYNTAKLRPDNLQRLPGLRDKIDNPKNLDDEKALFFLQQHHPEKLIKRLPLRAILLPSVSGDRDTFLQPAAPHDSLIALLLSTMHQLAGTDQNTVNTIKELVNQYPSYTLHLGSDLEQIPQIIQYLLDGESVLTS